MAWQSLGDDGLGQLGLTSVEVRSAAWWLDTSGRRWRGHQAVGKALEAGGGWRRCAATLVMAPATSWMAAGIYQVVVRYRHLLPGATAACGAPRS